MAFYAFCMNLQAKSPHSKIVNTMLSDIFRKSRFGLFKL